MGYKHLISVFLHVVDLILKLAEGQWWRGGSLHSNLSLQERKYMYLSLSKFLLDIKDLDKLLEESLTIHILATWYSKIRNQADLDNLLSMPYLLNLEPHTFG